MEVNEAADHRQPRAGRQGAAHLDLQRHGLADFTKLPTVDAPVLKFRELAEDVEQPIGDLMVTPVAVTHTVPTSGFIVQDGVSGVVYSGDTDRTEALWRAARNVRGLGAIILECAFPNRLEGLAKIARHMTPELIRRELDKLPPDVPVLIFHVKPQFYDEIGEQLRRGQRQPHQHAGARQDLRVVIGWGQKWPPYLRRSGRPGEPVTPF